MLKNLCAYVAIEDMCCHEFDIHGLCIKVVMKVGCGLKDIPFVMFPLSGRFERFIHSNTVVSFKNI